jgi:hypothetical protein
LGPGVQAEESAHDKWLAPLISPGKRRQHGLPVVHATRGGLCRQPTSESSPTVGKIRDYFGEWCRYAIGAGTGSARNARFGCRWE